MDEKSEVLPASSWLGWESGKFKNFRAQISVLEGPDGCWRWEGSQTLAGYGQFGAGGTFAHRWSYQIWVGPIPRGFQIHHQCRNRWCVNPRHLEALSPKAHGSLHSKEGKRTKRRRVYFCVRGHAFDNKNTGYKPNGKRWCKACNKDSCFKRYHETHEPPTPRTHCKRGHPIEGYNVLESVSKRTGKLIKGCRECLMQAVRRYQATAKGRAAKKLVKARAKATASAGDAVRPPDE